MMPDDLKPTAMPRGVAIVVPVYRKVPSANEAKVLIQAAKVLHPYPIFFMTHRELDLTPYGRLLPSAKVRYFDKSCFESVDGYNRLLLRKEFYQSFCEFEHMLIYQTDAWVFQDSLGGWCRKNLDYCGAPWLVTGSAPGNPRWAGVGNGGLSLRRIPKILRWFLIAERTDYLRKEVASSGVLGTLVGYFKHLRTLRAMTGCYDVEQALFSQRLPVAEDHFWCGETWEEFKDAVRDLGLVYLAFLPWLYWRLRKPSPRQAARFAFEMSPSYLFAMNRRKLPFGCHAWEKWEPEFWSTYIP